MNDRYLEFTHSSFGAAFSRLLGLPQPPRLRRARSGFEARPFEGRPVLVGAGEHARLSAELLGALKNAGAVVRIDPRHPGLAALKRGAASQSVALVNEPGVGEGEPAALLVFDASGMREPGELRRLYDFFQPRVRSLPANSRIVVVADDPVLAADGAEQAATAAAATGFVRSLAKEVGRKGTIVNLIQAARDAGPALAGPLRWLLSDHAAYVTGQVLPVGAPVREVEPAWARPLEGRVALVTGAARGIGAAIASALAREGARVVGVDRAEEEAQLATTLSPLGGVGITADITAPDAPARIAEELADRFGGVDIVVHNAGITRDKMLRNMKPEFWDQVLEVNLGAILRINRRLLDGVMRDGGRMVCISSIGGIAGNAGQTNYAATKAGVIGYVQALAGELAGRGIGVNAVAPGFIETQMTARMPLVPREVGRRINSLSQGGLPQDIAEAVAFLASDWAVGVRGRTLRVCGQNWFGA